MTYTVEALKVQWEDMLKRINGDIEEVEILLNHQYHKQAPENAYVSEYLLNPLDDLYMNLRLGSQHLKVLIESCKDLTDEEVM